jgi:hypothetical protein
MIVSISIKYSFSTFINGMDTNILGAGYAHASYANNIISDISTLLDFITYATMEKINNSEMRIGKWK